MEKKLTTQAALARAVGIDKGNVSRHIGRGWPFGRGPWSAASVPKIKAWLNERRQENNNAPAEASDAELAGIGAMTPLQKLRCRNLIERNATIKFKRELEMGGYVLLADAERERVARVFAVRARLADIPQQSHRLVGKTEPQIAAELVRMVKDVCDWFAGGNE